LPEGEIMGKNIIGFVIIVVVGALLGSFLGKFVSTVVPAGSLQDMFRTEVSAGLNPTTLNLQVLELTFGCLFKFNITAVIGIFLAAYLFRSILK